MHTQPLGIMAVVIGVASFAGGDEPAPGPRFAEPVRIQAGGPFLGEGRLFPSPVLHDVDADGTPEVLVGDLFGAVTVARRDKTGLGTEKPLLTRHGTPLKFHNW